MIKLLGFILALLAVTAMPTAEAAKSVKVAKETQPVKEKLVLMPMRLGEEDKSLQGAMETALVEGLQLKYEVFSGEQVAQKAREIFLKESRSTAKKECDETRCMQGIAEAFQAELIATANVTKQSAGYFLALSIQNIFDNKVVYSKSIPCRDCDAFQVVDKLKELSEVGMAVVPAVALPEPVKAEGNTNDPETALWHEVNTSSQIDDYEAYLTQYPNGKFAVLANSRIKKLKDAAISEGNRKEREAWEAADKAGSEESYKSYLKGWPSGKYAGQAEERIRKLQADIAESSKLINTINEIFAQAERGGSAELENSKLETLKNLADHGNANAQGKLARMYTNGWGVTKDYLQGRTWALKAAEQGNADGYAVLGFSLANGFGITKDEIEGVKWLRKAAEQGNAAGQANLGVMYANGRGVTKDEAEAVRWYRKAAEQGNAGAQTNLGVMYVNGTGVTKDDAEAVRWYRKAAEQGNAVGQKNLGAMYANGTGVTKDEAEAVRWYRKAAEQGQDVAQNNLGAMYAYGRGVTKDEAEAVRWYRKAAEQGQNVAQKNLGVMYANGRGVTKDEAEAVRWYRKAAEQGNEAAKILLKAAEQGN